MEENVIISFLNELKNNNSREWMAAHKDFYQSASRQFEQLVADLIRDLTPIDPSIAHLHAKDLIFRLNRDTRFSNDKSPYNPSFRAHISSCGRAPVPVGYFIMLTPEHSFFGGGFYASMFKDATAMIRDSLAEHGDEFLSIIGAPDFRNHFTLVGERLKNVPKGYDAGHPCAEYLKYKSLAIECPVPDSLLSDLPELRKTAGEIFPLMIPFNTYLNRALKDFKMPER